MKYLLVLILGFAIALSSNVFAGGKDEAKEEGKGKHKHEHKEAEKDKACCPKEKADKPEMCEMEVSGKMVKCEAGEKGGKCVIETADGEKVICHCSKEQAEECKKMEGKNVKVCGKGIEKKDKEGKCHKMIKSVDKIEEAPSAPAPGK